MAAERRDWTLKINRVQLGEVLLMVTLDQFQGVPAEAEIEHIFSQSFQEKNRSITKRSESAAWRFWQTPVKRAALITILIMVMLVTVACATPVIRNAIIDFFSVEAETAYGITFDPYDAANAPRVIENVYIPAFEPEGYTLVLKECDDSRVSYIWRNEYDEYIYYRQSLIRQGATDSTWIGIDAEETSRTRKNINGYLVEVLSDIVEQQYVAVWTDNRYIYTVDVSVFDSDPEHILEAIMNSLIEVEAID